MAGLPLVDNPIAWAQVQLRGGLKRLIVAADVYGVVLGGTIFLSLRVDPKSATWALSMWTKGLLGIQAGILILLACSVIAKSVRKDMATRMIESHRLTPVSAAQAVSGYIAGAAFQPICIAIVNLLLGVFTAAGAGEPVGRWLLTNAILAWFAMCLWAGAAYVATVTQRGLEFGLVLIIVAGMGGGLTFAFVPAVVLLVTPIIGDSIFGSPAGGSGWSGIYPISIAAQAILAVLFHIAAARKYRRDDAVAFGPWLGLGLLAGWVTLSIVGVANWRELRPTFWDVTSIGAAEQVIASTLVALFVAMIPISGAACIRAKWERARSLNDSNAGRKPISPMVVALVCAAVCLLLPMMLVFCSGSKGPAMKGIRIGVMLGAQLLSLALLLSMTYRASVKPPQFVIAWIFLVWLIPLLAEFISQGLTGRSEWSHQIMVFSPIGTLTAILVDWPVGTTPPLVVQVLLAAVLAILFCVRGRSPSADGAQSARTSLPSRPSEEDTGGPAE
jgi:hypothetical protein